MVCITVGYAKLALSKSMDICICQLGSYHSLEEGSGQDAQSQGW